MLAAAGSDIPSWWPFALAVGSAVGGFITAALSGKLVVPTWTYNKETARADKAESICERREAEIARLNGVILATQERDVRALEAAATAMKEANGVIHDLELRWATRPPA